MILEGNVHPEIIRLMGGSRGTISVIRQELKRSFPLYRATGQRPCVPIACRTAEDSEAPLRQPLEKVGRPGRTRTDDNTVMSGLAHTGQARIS